MNFEAIKVPSYEGLTTNSIFHFDKLENVKTNFYDVTHGYYNSGCGYINCVASICNPIVHEKDNTKHNTNYNKKYLMLYGSIHNLLEKNIILISHQDTTSTLSVTNKDTLVLNKVLNSKDLSLIEFDDFDKNRLSTFGISADSIRTVLELSSNVLDDFTHRLEVTQK